MQHLLIYSCVCQLMFEKYFLLLTLSCLQGTDGESGEKGEDGEAGQPVSSFNNYWTEQLTTCIIYTSYVHNIIKLS